MKQHKLFGSLNRTLLCIFGEPAESLTYLGSKPCKTKGDRKGTYLVGHYATTEQELVCLPKAPYGISDTLEELPVQKLRFTVVLTVAAVTNSYVLLWSGLV